MRMLLLVALVSGVGAYTAADRAQEGEPPSWAEHRAFIQSSLTATVARVTGDAPTPAESASQPAPTLADYPLLAGLAASVAVLAYGGLLWLAVRLGAIP